MVEDIVIAQTMRSIFQSHSLDAIVEHVMMWQKKENTTLPLLQRELAEVEKSLANVMSAIEQGIITSTTKNRMKELEDLKTDIEVKIAREEIQTQILTKEQAKFWLQRMADFDLANHDNKQRIVDTFINSIYVYDDRLVINFNCREDSETIPLELSVFGSDLTMMGEPYWNSPNIKKCSDFLVFVPALDVFAMRVGIFN